MSKNNNWLFKLFSLMFLLALVLTACGGRQITIGDPETALEQAADETVDNFVAAQGAACETLVLAGPHEIRPSIMEVLGHPVIKCQTQPATKNPVTNMTGLVNIMNSACTTAHTQGNYTFTWNTIVVDSVTVPCNNPITHLQGGIELGGTAYTMVAIPVEGETYLWASGVSWGFFIVDGDNIPLAWIQNGTMGSKSGELFTFNGLTGFVQDNIVPYTTP